MKVCVLSWLSEHQARRLDTRWERKMGKHEGKYEKTYKEDLRTKKTECAFGHLLRRIEN